MKPNPREEKKAGSALLVVLGFLSFMVVSAVAFAIYMRAERVPSSALRRNVATRHLVKAALANAISRVDDAIRADQFPGLANTNNNSTANCYHDSKGNAMDVWYGRVFMPPDPDGTTEPGQAETRFAPVTETVSVLNLEALGYIPPPLVNDVRFLSRSTWTAKWQNFSFDAGRFAFCAVNVSDYFDVNRATAEVRTSDPESRISLAYLLRSDEQHLDNVDTAAAKTFMDNFGPKASARKSYSNPDQNGGSVPATVPYVSMLDYNLALGEMGNAGIANQIRSLFCWWVDKDSSNQRYFYADGAAREDTGVRQAARQPFVTDSWNVDLAVGNVDSTTNYLHGANATDDSQPFSEAIMKKEHDQVKMIDVYQDISRSPKWNSKNNDKVVLDSGDQIALFDYLDGNDYPMSLAFPCVERVPMVAAIAPQSLTVNLNMAAQASRTEAGSNEREQYLVTDFKLDGEVLGGALATLIAFPFRRGEEFPKNGYSAQAIVRVILAPKGITALRSGVGAMQQLRPTTDEWDNDVPAFQTKGGLAGAFVFTARSMEASVSISNVRNEEDMVRAEAFVFNRVPANDVVFRSRVKQTKGLGENATWTTVSGTEEFQVPVLPFTAEGNLQEWDRTAWIKQADFSAQIASQEFVPYVFAWVRIMKDGDAVDYVPAHYADDKDMLGIDNSTDPVAEDIGGRQQYPFLRWTANGNVFKFPASTTPSPYSCGDWAPKTYFTVDPRFNWAPEDWIQSDDAIGPSAWLGIVDSALGRDGRDSDPFLFVSNQAYLQSIGELAFLPRLSNLGGGSALAKSYDGVPRTEVDKIANAACVWTSFRPYAMEGGNSDFLFRRGVVDGEGSVAVNPYTDDASVRLAAFANTPYDWWAAGTNSNAGSVGGDATKEYFNLKKNLKYDKSSLDKYAFTDGNPVAKLEYQDVVKIATVVCEAIRSQPDRPWEDVYDSLDWYGINNTDEKNFLGVQLNNPLYGDDRKFLYAYWRDCFANKQQLFLIFVRAESTALGGPGEGTPSQQGGRAVALVWREPQSNVTDGGNGASDDKQTGYLDARRPHRMRVLFYHQFD